MLKFVLSSLIVSVVVLEFAQARALNDEYAASIPAPNQDFADEYSAGSADIEKLTSVASTATGPSPAPNAIEAQQAAPSNEASVPVYASPFVRAERSAPRQYTPTFESQQESSHAPPNYAPRPSASSDLKTSASYGHHHHGGHGYGYGPSGWLDMGAWTGGKGSFGWYADYPVGGKHHGYGRK